MCDVIGCVRVPVGYEADRQTDKQIDRQADRQTNRQVASYIFWKLILVLVS